MSGDHVRKAIQSLLDEDGEGWQVDDYVICVGLERIEDGHIETAAWYYAPVEQAEHCTDGLLNAATALRQEAQA